MFLRKPSSSGVSWTEETCSRQFQDVTLKYQLTKGALPSPVTAHNSASVVAYKYLLVTFPFFGRPARQFYTITLSVRAEEKRDTRVSDFVFTYDPCLQRYTFGHNDALFL